MELTLCTNKTCKIRNKCYRAGETTDNYQSWAEFGGDPCPMFIQKYRRVWYCDGCGKQTNDPMQGLCECGHNVYNSEVEPVNE